MIFVGDVSLTKTSQLKLNAPDWFFNNQFIVNLEGSLVSSTNQYLKKKLVVNDLEKIRELFFGQNVIFNLANNHVLDNADISETIKNCNDLGIDYFGAGENLLTASKPYISDHILVLTFGWSVIECKYASKNDAGVNPLIENYVKSELAKYRKTYPEKKIIINFHWDYELEAYPMPSQRRLAFELIDLGCDCIVGAHPHRVQGTEYYKNKPIIYSLGNWMFEQGTYCDGKLVFPEFCNMQLAFEFSLQHEHKCHFFLNNKALNTVEYIKTDYLNSSEQLDTLSPFRGMSHGEYDFWFKQNRHHKKFIPVYYSNEHLLISKSKDFFNVFRTKFINLLVKIGVK